MNEQDDTSEKINGKSEFVFTHSKRKRTVDIIQFVFWALIGLAFIIIGIVLQYQNLFLRITLIVAGTILIFTFLESFIAKFTNKIILNSKTMKMRDIIKWNEIAWENIISIELDRRETKSKDGELKKRVTMMKINTSDEDYILYPLFKYTAEDSNSIVEMILVYYEQNKGVSLDEKTMGEEKTKERFVEETPEELEERINLQIPQRVQDFELVEETKEDN